MFIVLFWFLIAAIYLCRQIPFMLRSLRTSWKSWLAATKKVITYERHRVGRTAANDGFAAKPPPHVFVLARDFPEERAATDAAGQLSHGTEGEAAKALEGNNDWVKIVMGVVRSQSELGVAAVKSAGVPTILTLLCIVLVVMQQRDVQRLTGQVEELVNAVSDLRNKIE